MAKTTIMDRYFAANSHRRLWQLVYRWAGGGIYLGLATVVVAALWVIGAYTIFSTHRLEAWLSLAASFLLLVVSGGVAVYLEYHRPDGGDMVLTMANAVITEPRGVGIFHYVFPPEFLADSCPKWRSASFTKLAGTETGVLLATAHDGSVLSSHVATHLEAVELLYRKSHPA